MSGKNEQVFLSKTMEWLKILFFLLLSINQKQLSLTDWHDKMFFAMWVFKFSVSNNSAVCQLMSDISKMPDGLSNSIASFLKRTDKVTEDLKNGWRERELSLMPEHRDMSYGRDIRSTSVARASSVARQFEPSPTGTFHK